MLPLAVFSIVMFLGFYVSVVEAKSIRKKCTQNQFNKNKT